MTLGDVVRHGRPNKHEHEVLASKSDPVVPFRIFPFALVAPILKRFTSPPIMLDAEVTYKSMPDRPLNCNNPISYRKLSYIERFLVKCR